MALSLYFFARALESGMPRDPDVFLLGLILAPYPWQPHVGIVEWSRVIHAIVLSSLLSPPMHMCVRDEIGCPLLLVVSDDTLGSRPGFISNVHVSLM